MTLINLDKSYFKCLKSAETDSAAGDGGDLGDGVRNLKNLVQQIVGELDKSVESGKLDTCQLLARPSVVSLIDEFICKHEESESVSSNKKNSEKSAEYRKRGNEEYGLGNFSSAVYYYTMAVIYAPDVSEKVDDNVDDNNVPEELSLAYGNRSAVFYELGQFEAALTDIDHSLATGYPRENQFELLLLKVECLISLKKLGEAKRVLEQLCRIAEPKDVRALKTRLQLLDINLNVDVYPSQKQSQSVTDPLIPVLNYLTRTERYQPWPDFASLSTKVEPQYSQQKGRHLVAKQDIEPGDILMVESPFASVLGKHFEYHFCHHCYRKLETNIGNEDNGECCITGSVIPCTECTRVLYCSSDCRSESWRTYHQYECSILPILYQMSHSSHLSLRMLLSTGLDVIQQVSDQDFNDNESKDCLSSLKLSDPADSAQHYKLVHSLIDLQHLIPPEQFVEFVIISSVLVQLTKKCAAFVRTTEQTNLAATVLLRHLLLVNANSSKLANFQFIGTGQDDDDDDAFAIGLYPYHSALLNYSCEPNSMSTHVHSTVLIQRASKRIAAGSEVTVPVDSYVSVMGQHLTARREHLWNVYHFQCECSRCVLEERDGMDGKYFPIGCKDCGSTLTRASSSSDTFHCSSSSCASSMSLSEAQQLYARIESKFSTAEGRILSFESSPSPEKNFENLFKCEGDLSDLSAIQGLRNCWQLVELLRRLSVAFQSINLQAKARKHLERLCEISEALHGLDGAPATQLNLINLFIESGPDDDDDDGGGDDDSGQPISVHWFEKLRGIAQRTIEIVGLILLAEVEPPPTDDGPDDLLADDSRSLREVHTILKNLIDYCKENEEYNILCHRRFVYLKCKNVHPYVLFFKIII